MRNKYLIVFLGCADNLQGTRWHLTLLSIRSGTQSNTGWRSQIHTRCRISSAWTCHSADDQTLLFVFNPRCSSKRFITAAQPDAHHCCTVQCPSCRCHDPMALHAAACLFADTSRRGLILCTGLSLQTCLPSVHTWPTQMRTAAATQQVCLYGRMVGLVCRFVYSAD